MVSGAGKGTIANCTAALNEVVLPMAATGDLSGDWLASADDTGFVDFLSTLVSSSHVVIIMNAIHSILSLRTSF